MDAEARALASDLSAGNPHASVHLARLIEADAEGALLPFAQALAGRVLDLLALWRRQGVEDLDTTVDDGMYDALRLASTDWDGFPCSGADGEAETRPPASFPCSARHRAR